MSRDYDSRRGESGSSCSKLRMDINSSHSRSRGEGSRKRKELDNVMRKAREFQSNYWNKKLLEVEEKDPNRWRHTGFKEMYIGGASSGSSRNPQRSPRQRGLRPRSPRSPRSPRIRSPNMPRCRTPKNKDSSSPRRRISKVRTSHTSRSRSPTIRRSRSPRRRSPWMKSHTPRPRSPRTPNASVHDSQVRVVKSPSSGSTCSDKSCSVCSPQDYRRPRNTSRSRSKSSSPLQSRIKTKRIRSSRTSLRLGEPRSPSILQPHTPPILQESPHRLKTYNKLTKDLNARKKETHRNKVLKDQSIPDSIQMVFYIHYNF